MPWPDDVLILIDFYKSPEKNNLVKATAISCIQRYAIFCCRQFPIFFFIAKYHVMAIAQPGEFMVTIFGYVAGLTVITWPQHVPIIVHFIWMIACQERDGWKRGYLQIHSVSCYIRQVPYRQAVHIVERFIAVQKNIGISIFFRFGDNSETMQTGIELGYCADAEMIKRALGSR